MIRPVAWILNRSDQAGMFMAVGGLAATLQRTLMPRNNLDQAMVSGLSMALSYQIASLVNDGVEALAAIGLAARSRRSGSIPSEKDQRMTSFVLNAAVALAGLGLQKTLAQRDDESLLNASGRTAGFFLSAGSFAGGAAAALEVAAGEFDQRQGHIETSQLPLPILGGMALAAAVDYQRRQREGEFDAAGQRRFSILVSLPLGVGVGLALAAFGLGNRVLAGFIGRTLGRLLPGSDRLWSPIGRLTTLGILAGSIFGLVHTVYSIIESKSERIEPAFEDPPETKLVTSGAGSAIDWSTLGYKGRRYVASVNSRRQIEEAMQQPATDPVRVYIGLETASTPEERVRLALDELERTGRSRES